MIKRLDLHNFKGFRRFTVSFGGDAFLVGPNNAGKSTVIAALRSAANMVRIAGRSRATVEQTVDGMRRTGHMFASEQVALESQNLPHDFHPEETRLRVGFSRGLAVTAIWSPGEYDGGFFFTEDGD